MQFNAALLSMFTCLALGKTGTRQARQAVDVRQGVPHHGLELGEEITKEHMGLVR